MQKSFNNVKLMRKRCKKKELDCHFFIYLRGNFK